MKQLILLCMLWACTLHGQEFFDKEYPSSDIEHVLIDNFKGDIHVVSSDATQIKIKAIQKNGSTGNELQLKEFMKGNVLAIYIDNPCKKLEKEFDPDHPFRFLRTENNCTWEGFDMDVIPTLDFEIQVPEHMNVYLSTIMDGKVYVKGISGEVFASNVNGSVELVDVADVRNGTTVNGDVDVSFNQKPSIASKFSTINGEININVPSNASLKTRFKSFNGELYTDFDAVTIQQDKITTSVNSGQMIKIKEFSEAKIGSGEVVFTIETFNNNAYLRKI